VFIFEPEGVQNRRMGCSKWLLGVFILTIAKGVPCFPQLYYKSLNTKEQDCVNRILE